MNSAKNVSKNNGAEVNSNTKKNQKEQKKQAKQMKNKALLIGGVVVAVAMIAAVCYSEFRPHVIATMKDKKITLADAMYDIYTTETQYNNMSNLYQQIYKTDFWDAEIDDEGTLGAEKAKDDVMARVQQREVLCVEAKANGVSLTAEEEKKAVENVESITKNLTAGQKNLPGLSESAIKEVLKKEALANKFKQQRIATYTDITEDSVKGDIKKEDYRQYDLQYYFAPFDKTDKDGKSTKVTDAEKDDLKKAMEAIEDKVAKEGKNKDFDFTKLVDEKDKSGVEFKTENLVETNTSFLTDDLRKQLKKMKNGEYSSVIEAEDGYYYFRMDNNNSDEAYKKAIEEAITTKQEQEFQVDYATIATEYHVSVNDDEWDQIELRNYTAK